MKKNLDVPGNAMQSAINVQVNQMKLARPIFTVQNQFEQAEDPEIRLVSIRLKAPDFPQGSWLAVVKGATETANLVAFHKADDLVDTIKGVFNRLANGSLTWKEDNYG